MLEFVWKKLRIVVRFSFFAVLLLMLELLKSDWGLWCAGASLLHEAGHILAYAAMGSAPREIHFECGGIRIVPPEALLRPKKEALVLAAGSFANFLAGGILLTLGCRYAAGFHLLLGAFNLLPLRALDGGQLLGLLAERFFSLRTAERLCQAVSLLFLAPLLWGGWLLFQQSGNFSLLLTLACLLAATFPARRKSV